MFTMIAWLLFGIAKVNMCNTAHNGCYASSLDDHKDVKWEDSGNHRNLSSFMDVCACQENAPFYDQVTDFISEDLKKTLHL